MSDRSKWESRRRSPNGHYNNHQQRSSSSERSYRGSRDKERDNERDRKYDKERDRGSSQNKEYDRYDRERDRGRNRERDRDRDRDRDKERDEWRQNRYRYRDNDSKRDREDRYKKDSDRYERSSSFEKDTRSFPSRRDSHEKRPHTPPFPPPPPSNTFNTAHKHQDSSSSGYNSSPFPGAEPPPPPPPSNPPSMTQRLTSLYLADNKQKEKAPPPPASKPTLNRSSSNASSKPDPVKSDLRNYKLLLDPMIKKGHTKITRYDGVLTGQPPVVPKDPRQRKSKIWTLEQCDLPVPTPSMDKNYVGPMPRDTIRFSNLNDNIDRKFLYELCEAYGDILEHKVYFDPKSNRHMGTGKVVFDNKTKTDSVVSLMDGRSVMGNEIKAWIDVKNPPGHSMWKQLEVECLSRDAKIAAACRPPPVQPISSQHQSTPSTPTIGSLQRNQPVAPSYMNNQSIPPPPPPSNSYGGRTGPMTPPSMGGPSERSHPPPPPPSNKYYKSKSRNSKYSPVSDQSNSPKSPRNKHSNTAYEAISDSETNKDQVEDISPASGTGGGQDDDNMSLSPISPTDANNKVELNIHQHQNLPLPQQNMLPVPGNAPPGRGMPFPLIPPLPIPQPPQNFGGNYFPPPIPQPPPQGGMNQPMQPMNNFVPPPQPQPPFNHNLQQQMPYQPQPPPQMPQQPAPSLMQQNLIQNNNYNNNMQHSHTNMQQSQHRYQDEHQRDFHRNQRMLPQNTPHLKNNNIEQYQEQSNEQQAPTQQDLPFVFQVKAGCARDISQELKRILSRDTLKRLVEQSAFKAYENWWEKQKSLNEPKPESKTLGEEPLNNKANLKNSASIDEIKSTTWNKNKQALSEIVQSMFGPEKSMDNSSFLSSFRISRRPSASSTRMKQQTQSRRKKNSNRAWNKVKENRPLQRIEESSDDDTEDDGGESYAKKHRKIVEDSNEESDDQFEQFLKQRKVQKSGSSLYQKIYSDSETEQSQTEDEDDFIDDQTVAESTENSASDSDSSSDDSSDSDSSTTSSSDAEIEEEMKRIQKAHREKEEEQNALKTSTSETEAAHKNNDEEQITTDDKDGFRSMYDEPRRAAVEQAKKKIEKTVLPAPKRERKPKTDKPPPRKRVKKQAPPKIIEESSSSSESETESSSSETELSEAERHEEEETPMEVDDEKRVNNRVEENVEEKREIQNTKTSEEELINNLIMLEHNYFGAPPPTISVVNKTSDKGKHTKIDKTNHEIPNERKAIKRRLESPEKAELKYKFQMRTKEEENKIIWNIYDESLDDEDLKYMKGAFESLQQVASKEVDSYSWSDLPLPPIYKQKRVKGEAKLRIHKTGSARSEGYYKIEMKEKAQYLKSALRQLTVLKQRDDVDEKTAASQASAEQKMKSRENRAMQRRLASSFAQEEFASLINYNQALRMRKKALRFQKSSIHNWGLFALEPIAAEEFVCEYVGTMVRSIVAELREQRYEKSGIGSSYLFRLDMESVIDATKTGCNARFINHSCQPNCYAKVILVEGAKKIVIYSKYDIALGEEITYDYKFPIEDEKIPCLCGAPQCRGSLN